jgi:hypothetical protein
MNTNHQATPYLQGIPEHLREPLLVAFNEIVKNFREGHWEPSELNGGKLSEVVYTIIRGVVERKFPAKPQKPKNMLEACKALEAENKKHGRSLCIQIPRMLTALYEVRNNRGVGHVGGDVDPNHMDASLVVSIAKWIVAELIRIFHDVETEEATRAVDSLIEKTIPLIWRVPRTGRVRVLNPTLTMRHKTLALLFVNNGPFGEAELIECVEHSNPTVFRRDVLTTLHDEKLIEYDGARKEVHISPLGVRFVEEHIPLQI